MMEAAIIVMWSFIAIVTFWDVVWAVRSAWTDNSSNHFQITVIGILALMIIAVVLWQ